MKWYMQYRLSTQSGPFRESGMLTQPCYAAGTIIYVMLPIYT
ncbi:hypothetical protein HPTD01_2781 [Halomonas sp. TD01]|nr:hypothetical protein HPTD01_2781 [Halomonas sp. TD01]